MRIKTQLHCAEATVVSFLPAQGRVTVLAKQSGNFYVRVPGFASHKTVAAWRDGHPRDRINWMGEYVAFESARKGEELTVTYPLLRFAQKFKRAGTDYTVSWRGNALTHLEPMGGIWPLLEKIPYPIPPFPRAEPTRQ